MTINHLPAALILVTMLTGCSETAAISQQDTLRVQQPHSQKVVQLDTATNLRYAQQTIASHARKQRSVRTLGH